VAARAYRELKNVNAAEERRRKRFGTVIAARLRRMYHEFAAQCSEHTTQELRKMYRGCKRDLHSL
jgi:hypothetical protein